MTNNPFTYDFGKALQMLLNQAYAGHLTKVQFVSMMKSALDQAALRAWQSASHQPHYTGSMAMPAALKDSLAKQKSFVQGFATAVFEAVGAPTPQFAGKRTQIAVRALMWNASALHFAAIAEGVVSPFVLVRWRVGQTEHCTTCKWLDGQVHPRKWFADRGYWPHKPGTTALECGGWLCQCRFESLEMPMPVTVATKALVREAVISGLAGAVAALKAFDPAKHPHKPAGDSTGGQFAPKSTPSAPAASAMPKTVPTETGQPHVWWHGTATPDTFDQGDVVYLSDDARQVMPYAEMVHYMGQMPEGAKPQALRLHTKPGKTLDIAADMDDHMMEDDADPDKFIADRAAAARQAGYRYLYFQHPSNVADTEYQNVLVSLYPKEDLQRFGFIPVKGTKKKDFDSQKHPHKPKGDEHGGEFAPKGTPAGGTLKWETTPEFVGSKVGLPADMARDEMEQLSKILPDATLAVRADKGGELQLEWTHPQVDTFLVWIGEEDNRTKATLGAFFVKPEAQGKGLATGAFSRMAKILQAHGVSEIGTWPEHDEDENGHYTWARLGFDAPLPTDLDEPLPASLRGAHRVSDLMKTADGRAWWKANGSIAHMDFDLSEGSRSWQTLNTYLSSKQPVKANLPAPPEPWKAEREASKYAGTKAGSRTRTLLDELHKRAELNYSLETKLWQRGPLTSKTAKSLLDKKDQTIAEIEAALNADIDHLHKAYGGKKAKADILPARQAALAKLKADVYPNAGSRIDPDPYPYEE